MRTTLKFAAVSTVLALYFVAHYCDLKRHLGLPTTNCSRYCTQIAPGQTALAEVRL